MPKNSGITLEDVQKRKMQIRKLMEERRKVMQHKTQQIFTPSEELTRWDHTLNMVSNGIALYDGVMMGFRLMGRVRNFFRRKK